MFRLDGKVALITGAAGGLGDKIARTLHAQGAKLALTDMRLEPMENLKNELGDNVECFVANLSNPEAIAELIKNVEVYKQNIDDLIFKARNKHIQNVQYGKLPMEFDYMILNLFTDLDRTSEHCMNVSWMILKKERNKTLSEFVYAW